MAEPRLSLCMIVKNEEECIGRCLESVHDLVDEIVIVDTGSTDDTIRICESYNARVEKFEWNGSFSDARNYGLNKSSGNWVMWLDADEEVDHEGRHLLKDAPEFDQYDVMTILLINYYGDKVDKYKSTDIAHTRLFRRSTGVQFINKIHECLDIVGLPPERIGHLDLKVHHYGYLDEEVTKKDKFQRNFTMLKKQLQENESVYWSHYYIASEFYRNRQFQEAFDHVNLSIAAFLKEQMLPPSMVYKLKYLILISSGSFEGAWPGIERAVTLYPDYVDLRFFMGMVLYHLEKIDSALQCFEQCIQMGENNINHLILRGVGSFQAWHYKGLCELKLGETCEAVNSFLQALDIHPQYSYSIESLTKLFQEDGIPDIGEIEKRITVKQMQALQTILNT